MNTFSWPHAKSHTNSHRGGGAIAAENSLEALQVSAAAGVGAVELDVHEISDGTLWFITTWKLPSDREWIADTTTGSLPISARVRYLELSEAFSAAKQLGLGI